RGPHQRGRDSQGPEEGDEVRGDCEECADRRGEEGGCPPAEARDLHSQGRGDVDDSGATEPRARRETEGACRDECPTTAAGGRDGRQPRRDGTPEVYGGDQEGRPVSARRKA